MRVNMTDHRFLQVIQWAVAADPSPQLLTNFPFSSQKRAKPAFQPRRDMCHYDNEVALPPGSKIRCVFKVCPHAACNVTAGHFHQVQHLLSILTRTAGTVAVVAVVAVACPPLIKQMDHILSSTLLTPKKSSKSVFYYVYGCISHQLLVLFGQDLVKVYYHLFVVVIIRT